SIPARKSGMLALGLPADWAKSDALVLDAADPAGTALGRWTWMIASPTQMRQTIVVRSNSDAAPVAVDAGGTLTVKAGPASDTFDKASGKLAGVTSNGRTFSLRNGPGLSVGTATLTGFSGAPDGDDY